MFSDPDTVVPPTAGRGWQAIDDVLSELARLAESASSADDFYRELLARCVHVLAAVGGAVWLREPSGGVRLACQLGLDRIALADPQVSSAWHAELLNAALHTEHGICLAPSPAGSGSIGLANPTPYLLMVARFASQETAAGVFEIFQRSDCPPEAAAGGLRFLAALGELACQFDRRQWLRHAHAREELWSQLQAFGLRAHRSLDLEAAADEIANEGRPIVGCDRLSVFTGDAGRARALSISGVDVVDRRATAVRLLERLVHAVLKAGDPLWYPPPDAAEGMLPAQLEVLIEQYLDHSHARSIGILPLGQPDGEPEAGAPDFWGALVAEAFTTGVDKSLWPDRLATIAKPSSLALANAQQYESVPLARVWQYLRPRGGMFQRRRLVRVAAATFAVVALAAAMALVPADFRIEARGELRPERRAEVFAPSDGIVSEVDAEHASQVAAGQVLAVLRKPELDFEFSRIAGETQTARKRLAAVQASRLGSQSAEAERTERGNQLTGEEEELKELIRSLEQQDRVLHVQRSQLTVRSPMQGQVLTWDVKQLLEARPVQRGQVLMTVANLAGPWLVELQIADDQAGHVLDARRQTAAPLPVSFVLATDPRTTYAGTIERIAMRTQLDANQRPVVTATVSVDRRQLTELRPGATVIARIDCGRRALGYVWFHGLLEAIRSRLWF
jgi:multidrug efflux pump subunit AcrA (membrane-fusion protein)